MFLSFDKWHLKLRQAKRVKLIFFLLLFVIKLMSCQIDWAKKVGKNKFENWKFENQNYEIRQKNKVKQIS